MLFFQRTDKEAVRSSGLYGKAIAPYIYYFKDARIARAGETPSYGLEFRELSGENIGRLNQGIVPGECITFLDSEGRMGRELLKILTKEKRIMKEEFSVKELI